MACLSGALLTIAVMGMTGGLARRTVEHPVIEKVAMTPVVSSPMVRGDRGVEAITDQVGPAIVRLEVDAADGTTSLSGVLFRDDGMILTSAHALRGSSAVDAVLADGRRLPARVLGRDDATDVAVVHVEGDGFPVVVLGSTERLWVGATAVAIGSPLDVGGGPFATTGVISATGRKVATADGRWLHGMIQTDAPVAAGCVGGALVDTTGAVIGIVTSSGAASEEGFGFATPVELARRVAGQLVESGRAVHGWLGIAGADLSATHAEALGIRSGALIEEVVIGGPADVAGLEPGDVLTALDGNRVVSMSALVVAMRDHEPGHDVVIGYRRDGRAAEATVTLSAKP
jgi:S1-C subfamily serine protease